MNEIDMLWVSDKDRNRHDLNRAANAQREKLAGWVWSLVALAMGIGAVSYLWH